MNMNACFLFHHQWAAFQGFLEMYERIGEQKYLKWAKHAMDVCLSYVVVWDIPLPAGRMADHRFKTTGWSVVSPQNQHIDVYGVLFAPEVYKMGNYTSRLPPHGPYRCGRTPAGRLN